MNKIYVSDPTELIKEIEKVGAAHFVWINRKSDTFIGCSESVSIIRETVALVKEGKSDDEVILALKEIHPDLFGL